MIQRPKSGPGVNPRGGSFLPPDDPALQDLRGRHTKESPAEPPAPEDAEDGLGDTSDPSENTIRALKPAADPQADEFKSAMHAEAKKIGLTVTDEDVMTFVFRNFLTKTVTVIPGVLSVQLRTLVEEDQSAVNMRLSSDLQEHPEMINQEMRNRNTMYILQRALMGMGKPGAIRPLDVDMEEKLKQLRQMAPMIISKIAGRYNLLEFLLAERLNEDDLVKN